MSRKLTHEKYTDSKGIVHEITKDRSTSSQRPTEYSSGAFNYESKEALIKEIERFSNLQAKSEVKTNINRQPHKDYEEYFGERENPNCIDIALLKGRGYDEISYEEKEQIRNSI